MNQASTGWMANVAMAARDTGPSLKAMPEMADRKSALEQVPQVTPVCVWSSSKKLTHIYRQLPQPMIRQSSLRRQSASNQSGRRKSVTFVQGPTSEPLPRALPQPEGMSTSPILLPTDSDGEQVGVLASMSECAYSEILLPFGSGLVCETAERIHYRAARI